MPLMFTKNPKVPRAPRERKPVAPDIAVPLEAARIAASALSEKVERVTGQYTTLANDPNASSEARAWAWGEVARLTDALRKLEAPLVPAEAAQHQRVLAWAKRSFSRRCSSGCAEVGGEG